MSALDFRLIGGPLPLDLWLALSTFVVCWEADELAMHMVSLGVDPGDEHDPDIAQDAQRRLGEIVRILEEHRDETAARPPGDEITQYVRPINLAECDDLIRRVSDVLASVSFTATGGDA
jgi:hypothetical protein